MENWSDAEEIILKMKSMQPLPREIYVCGGRHTAIVATTKHVTCVLYFLPGKSIRRQTDRQTNGSDHIYCALVVVIK